MTIDGLKDQLHQLAQNLARQPPLFLTDCSVLGHRRMLLRKRKKKGKNFLTNYTSGGNKENPFNPLLAQASTLCFIFLCYFHLPLVLLHVLQSGVNCTCSCPNSTGGTSCSCLREATVIKVTKRNIHVGGHHMAFNFSCHSLANCICNSLISFSLVNKQECKVKKSTSTKVHMEGQFFEKGKIKMHLELIHLAECK